MKQFAGANCTVCAELQGRYESLLFQQARLHGQLDTAEHLGDSQLLRCLKLEAYQVTARLKEAQRALFRHQREAHVPAVAASIDNTTRAA